MIFPRSEAFVQALHPFSYGMEKFCLQFNVLTGAGIPHYIDDSIYRRRFRSLFDRSPTLHTPLRGTVSLLVVAGYHVRSSFLDFHAGAAVFRPSPKKYSDDTGYLNIHNHTFLRRVSCYVHGRHSKSVQLCWSISQRSVRAGIIHDLQQLIVPQHLWRFPISIWSMSCVS